MGSNPVTEAINALQTALNDANTTDAQLKEKTSAVRAARMKARHDLEAAEKDLAPLLTTHEEAMLVVLGYLD